MLADEAAVWLVGRTRPRQERVAAFNCDRQGVEAYLPLIMERNVISRGRLYRSRLSPLFPGYLFIRTLQWRFLLGTFGLIDLIRSNEKPIPVSPDIIDDLKQREADGMVQLPDVPKNMFHADDRVRVIDGPFTGKLGLVAGYTAIERVRVLLDLLGRKVPVLIAEGQLEAA